MIATTSGNHNFREVVASEGLGDHNFPEVVLTLASQCKTRG